MQPNQSLQKRTDQKQLAAELGRWAVQEPLVKRLSLVSLWLNDGKEHLCHLPSWNCCFGSC